MDPSKKRLVIYCVLAVVLLAYLYYPSEEDTFYGGGGEAAEGLGNSGAFGLFKEFSEPVEEPVSLAAAPSPPPPAPTPPPSDVTESERVDYEAVFSEKSEVVPEAPPYRINEHVWVILGKIDTWYADPSSIDQETLWSYLMHRKLWVRLAALQFVMVTKIQNEAWLGPLRRQFLRNEHPSQARRFLRRVESIDPEAYFRMRTFLKL